MLFRGLCRFAAAVKKNSLSDVCEVGATRIVLLPAASLFVVESGGRRGHHSTHRTLYDLRRHPL